MTTLYEQIRKAAEADEPPVVLAKRMLEQLSKDELVGLLADEIARYQRNTTRHAEILAFGKIQPFPLPQKRSVTVNDLSSLQPLLPHSFSLGGGVRVTWAEATIEQHELRINFLRKKRDGIDRSIGHHVGAIALISGSGVSCLGELTQRQEQVA